MWFYKKSIFVAYFKLPLCQSKISPANKLFWQINDIFFVVSLVFSSSPSTAQEAFCLLS